MDSSGRAQADDGTAHLSLSSNVEGEFDPGSGRELPGNPGARGITGCSPWVSALERIQQ